MKKENQIKNILIISNGALNKTGVPCLILELSKLLIKEDFSVDVVYFSEFDNNILNDFIKLKVKVWYIPHRKRKRLFGSFLKKHNNYEAIHCFNEYDSLTFLSIARRGHIPIRILHTNGFAHNSKHLIKQIYLNIVKKCINSLVTKRVGCSKEVCESAFGNRKDCIVFPNPYDEDTYKYHEIQNKPEAISLVHVATFEPNKNQMFSIFIIEIIAKIYPNSKLFLIGSEFYYQDYVANMKSYVLKHGLSENVVFLRYDEDQIKYFDKSNYMIFPSFREGFGTVLLEAQSAGLKCFASDTVPKSTNFGGVTFLKLEDGAKQWANTIVSDYQINGWQRKPYNTDLHKKNNLIKVIREIYAK